MFEEFYKIRRLPPYVFEHINRFRQKEKFKNVDIIDLGMGNPDLPTPQFIVDKLCEAAQQYKNHRYSLSKGICALRHAQSKYYERRFGVKLNIDTQIVATIGSKEGFANMAQAITAPGDVILCPDPTYPIHSFGFLMSGGVIRSIPSTADENFLRALVKALRYSVPKPIAIILNYPANPTGYTADLDFYKEVVFFAKKHDIILLSDLAYAEIYFDNNPPPSILQIPNAIDISVEFTSMSKTFSMPGWRIGFAVGNEKLLAALLRVKSYLDYGAFAPIQIAATSALNSDGEDIKKIRDVYKKRRNIMIKSFANAGWIIPTPKASMFAWAPIIDKFKNLGSLDFSKLLLEKSNIIVAPGIGFGEQGDNYVRISLVETEDRLNQAGNNIKNIF